MNKGSIELEKRSWSLGKNYMIFFKGPSGTIRHAVMADEQDLLDLMDLTLAELKDVIEKNKKAAAATDAVLNDREVNIPFTDRFKQQTHQGDCVTCGHNRELNKVGQCFKCFTDFLYSEDPIMEEDISLCYCGHPKDRHQDFEVLHGIVLGFRGFRSVKNFTSKDTSCRHCPCKEYATPNEIKTS